MSVSQGPLPKPADFVALARTHNQAAVQSLKAFRPGSEVVGAASSAMSIASDVVVGHIPFAGPRDALVVNNAVLERLVGKAIGGWEGWDAWDGFEPDIQVDVDHLRRSPQLGGQETVCGVLARYASQLEGVESEAAKAIAERLQHILHGFEAELSGEGLR